MKEKELQKQAYILPEVKVYDVKSEGVICESGGLGVTRTDNYGDAIQEVW